MKIKLSEIETETTTIVQNQGFFSPPAVCDGFEFGEIGSPTFSETGIMSFEGL